MSPELPGHQLSSDLDYWEVRLWDGSVLIVRAHAYSEVAEAYVFVALMFGAPPYEYELLRIPRSSVDEISGGWPQPRSGAPNESPPSVG